MSRRERTIRTQTIVLRHKDWGEADRILWLYTYKLGKVQAIAKGVRKIHSRKAGHLEPFTLVNILMARGKDFFIVTQAETIDAFLRLREDLVRVGYGAYVVELLERFTSFEDENQAIYNLLKVTLTRINTLEDTVLPVRYFEIHLLDLLGYRPQLFNCVNCGETIQAEDQYFSNSQGGVLCPRCGPKYPDSKFIAMNTLKYMRHFQRSSFSEVEHANLTPDLNQHIESLLHGYFTYFLERNLNSPNFIRRVKNTTERE
jgi:DNA repair protein RecO (recombination protein O)